MTDEPKDHELRALLGCYKAQNLAYAKMHADVQNALVEAAVIMERLVRDNARLEALKQFLDKEEIEQAERNLKEAKSIPEKLRQLLELQEKISADPELAKRLAPTMESQLRKILETHGIEHLIQPSTLPLPAAAFDKVKVIRDPLLGQIKGAGGIGPADGIAGYPIENMVKDAFHAEFDADPLRAAKANAYEMFKKNMQAKGLKIDDDA